MNSGINMKIGERLKSLRKESGLTQKKKKKNLNLGQTTIAAYENGTHDPQIFSLIAYANFFECSVDYLLGRDDDVENAVSTSIKYITDKEKYLLDLYRSLTSSLQTLLIDEAIVMRDSDLNRG